MDFTSSLDILKIQALRNCSNHFIPFILQSWTCCTLAPRNHLPICGWFLVVFPEKELGTHRVKEGKKEGVQKGIKWNFSPP